MMENKNDTFPHSATCKFCKALQLHWMLSCGSVGPNLYFLPCAVQLRKCDQVCIVKVQPRSLGKHGPNFFSPRKDFFSSLGNLINEVWSSCTENTSQESPFPHKASPNEHLLKKSFVKVIWGRRWLLRKQIELEIYYYFRR